MPDREVPEADALEQRGAVPRDEGHPQRRSDVPEADALDQERALDDDTPEPPTRRPDVPEADALEQAATVPVDDEYDR